MSSRYQRWRSLPHREQWQLLALFIAQPTVSLALRLFGYKSTLAWLERASQHPFPQTATPTQLAAAERLAQLAKIAGRHGAVRVTCLRQALVIYAWLRRRGLQPQLKFGVDRLGATPDMHAWIELEGQAIAQPAMRHKAFPAATDSRQADTLSSTSGKNA